MSWCTIESDPGVFTELIQLMGVKGVQMEELIMVDADMLKQLSPIYGIVFLFKYRQEKEKREIAKEYPKDLFFMKQMIQDACATQAILSILLNIKNENVDIGSCLKDFKGFTESFSPEDRGTSLGSVDKIRNAHNSFNAQDSFIFDEEKSSSGKGDAFHFISYVPFDGVLYELDGLQQGPIKIGEYKEENDWINILISTIQKRISTYTENDLFSIQAMIRDRKDILNEKIVELKKDSIKNKLEINELMIRLKEEELKMENYKEENQRRRHNYLKRMN
eukprot:gene2908-4751_t